MKVEETKMIFESSSTSWILVPPPGVNVWVALRLVYIIIWSWRGSKLSYS